MSSWKSACLALLVLLMASIACMGGTSATQAPVATNTSAPTDVPATDVPAPTDVPATTAPVDEGGKKDIGEEVTIGGTYNVSGTNPDGSTYTGSMEIAGQGTVADVYWVFAGGAEVAGTAIWAQDSLLIAYPAENCILAVYLVSEDGNALEGYWVPPGSYDILPEVATVTEWDEANGILSFDVTGTNPDGSSYSAAMALTKAGDLYSVAQVSGETTFLGTGIDSDEYFAVSYGVDQGCGILQYHVDGNTLSGTWGDLSISDQFGYETATK